MKRLISIFCIIVGLSVCGYSLGSYYYQIHIGSRGKQAVRQVLAAPVFKRVAQPPTENEKVLTVVYQKRPVQGDDIGDLVIPKLNSVLPIIEGADENELARGVGHVSETVLPGEPDMCVLAGHRDTVFRDLGQLKIGDKLVVKTNTGEFTYQIEKTWIVNANDRTVIHSVKQPILLLSTCYPFNYIGPAPQRYLIQAKLVSRK